MKKMTILSLCLFASSLAKAEIYTIDPVHSSIGFTVRHLMVSKVHGKFERFEGWFDYTPQKPGIWKASATLDASSINTANPKRDEHLRSPDFLDVQKYPTMEFRLKGVESTREGPKRLKGNLTLHGVTKPVTLDLEIGGVVQDPWGGTRAGFSAAGKINRKDFGLTWNKALETGGVMVGDEVQIALEIEGILKK